MKCVTLFVHSAVAEVFVDALLDDSSVSGFTLTPCEGHSRGISAEPQLGPRDLVVGHVARSRIDIVVPAAQVDGLLGRLKALARADHSWGTWMVTDVAAFGRF